MPKKLVVICLINFLIAALMGLALRFSSLEAIGLNFRFLTHAHSHVAMLGWVYLMLYTLFVHYFIPKQPKVFNRLFWLTELAVVGMMLSFPFQGYAAISIFFSTLHIFCSYYFAYLIFKHHKTNAVVSEKLLKTSLIFMVVSTIGVWCLGPAVARLGQASAFYQIAIQFFLHFQFNGWFLIAVVAVFFHLLKVEDSKQFRHFFTLLIISTVLTFALPIQWFLPHQSLLFINGLGVVLQVVMLYKFIQLIKPKLEVLMTNAHKLMKYMFMFALICFVLKVVFQSLSILPEFSAVVYEHRNFVIGFIHLLMLGVISGFLFAFILKSGLVTNSKSLTVGIYSFVLGFLLTEILLLIQGIMFFYGIGILPNYYLLLFLFSVFLPLGIGFILFNIYGNTKDKFT
ncbi:hypothetical protein HNV10_13965 [Winogradskyella litoriviva]|uniref:Cytochrome C and Quinol oxidase polypeptide I n=1 Tax=Winogradskyella litoriviva TaxID=1220182 RepID=A0ABX2E7G8_9FLAO|nr:hypothetical protein [Winogradskyella litoriviva]NRD24360.1 hypothetical protein [Winogradskyella litoriviva]